MKKFLVMFAVASLFAVPINAEVLTVKKDTSMSLVAKFAGVYPVDILAMNPQLDGGAMVEANQKILYVSPADKSDALDFCKRELWRIGRGEKNTCPKVEMDVSIKALQTKPIVVIYSADDKEDGMHFTKILNYAEAYRQRHAKSRK